MKALITGASSGIGRKIIIIPGLRNHFFSCLGGGLYTRKYAQRVMKNLYQKVIP